MPKEGKIVSIWVLVLILLSALIRAVLAYSLELGNDEVYYWTYALFPDWSHFDHPPLLGWIIQFFTLDLYFDQVIFLRLASIVLGAASTWMVYLTGKRIAGVNAGLMAALLFTSSFYVSVIAGVFILPDTPQLFFWLLAVYFFMISLEDDEPKKKSIRYFLLAGIFTGLAMLSKYTSVFLWLGVFLFLLTSRKKWFGTPVLYLTFFLSLLFLLPVLIWNYQNNFISFLYQGGRVSGSLAFRPDFFFQEILGEIFYNNPVTVVLAGITVYSIISSRRWKVEDRYLLILCFSLPLIGIFWILSMFYSTLPHWTGPAYATLVLAIAVYLDERGKESKKTVFIPAGVRASIILLLVVITAAYFQLTKGLITNVILPSEPTEEQLEWDVSLDLYGWEQLATAMPDQYSRDLVRGRISGQPFLLSWRWFPAAHIDYYIARPMGWKLFALGNLERIHKYYWINTLRSPIPAGSDAYFICNSRDKKNPGLLYRDLFEKIELPDTIPVIRGGKRVMSFYIYPLRSYHPDTELIKSSFADRPIQ